MSGSSQGLAADLPAASREILNGSLKGAFTFNPRRNLYKLPRRIIYRGRKMKAPGTTNEKAPAWAGSSPAQVSGAGSGASPARSPEHITPEHIAIDFSELERFLAPLRKGKFYEAVLRLLQSYDVEIVFFLQEPYGVGGKVYASPEEVLKVYNKSKSYDELVAKLHKRFNVDAIVQADNDGEVVLVGIRFKPS